jgi:outer membrane protein assembly factor BamE (lipoprotein component of BamABCDE complex)
MTSTLRAIFVLALLALANCEKRLTKANVDQVQIGMAKKQVESILGMPTSVDVQEYDMMTKTTYVYAQESGAVTLVFWQDRLESKESTIRE